MTSCATAQMAMVQRIVQYFYGAVHLLRALTMELVNLSMKMKNISSLALAHPDFPVISVRQ